jgi:hypothetical protein
MYNRPMWFESLVQPAITHRLAGPGLAGGLVVYQGDGSASVYGSISQALGNALATAVKVTDQNGTPVTMTQLPNNGGWLANGCPLNVYFGQGWITGQQDALRAIGMTQCLPAAPVTQGTVPASATYNPGGPAYTPTLTTGGIVTGPSATAPQQTVYSSATPTPAVPIDTGNEPGASELPAAMPSWLPYAAAAVIALLLLQRKG